eukprot:1195550-Prorocentrum_minimum.AAC.1
MTKCDRGRERCSPSRSGIGPLGARIGGVGGNIRDWISSRGGILYLVLPGGHERLDQHRGPQRVEVSGVEQQHREVLPCMIQRQASLGFDTDQSTQETLRQGWTRTL